MSRKDVSPIKARKEAKAESLEERGEKKKSYLKREESRKRVRVSVDSGSLELHEKL